MNWSKQFAASSPAPVKHIWQPHDGFRKTVILNKTVAAANGDYLIFTDGDCVPHPKFVADHAALAEKGFWVQGRRCFVREEFVPQFVPGKIPAFGWMLAGKITGATKGIRLPAPLIFRNRKQRGIIGCNMAYWRDDVLAVNGFDETYLGRGIGPDSDLGTRVYHLGRWRKFVYGRAIVYHLDHPPAPARASRRQPRAARGNHRQREKSAVITASTGICDPMENILLIRLKSIGDVILTLPAVGVVRENFPAAKITFLTSLRKTAGLLLWLSGRE